MGGAKRYPSCSRPAFKTGFAALNPSCDQSIIGAGHLRDRALVDGGADLRFDLCNVFGDLFVAQSSLQRVLELLYVLGGEIDPRLGDVGHAKHDQLAAPRAWRLRGRLLWRAERRLN